MSIINTVAPGGVISGPLANVQALAIAQAAGAAGASPTGKLLLPTAVTAAVLVPNYNETKQPATNRPALKLVTSQPSSSLAAQLIAQSPDLSADDLALFTVRQQPQAQQAPVNPYASEPQPKLPNDPRGLVPQPTQVPPQALQPAAQAVTVNSITAAFAMATAKAPVATQGTKENASGSERSIDSGAAGLARKLSNTRASYQYVVEAARHHFTERAVEAVG